MRKNAKYLLVTLLTFLVALNVNAEECSYEEQVKMNNIASTVKATYEAVDIDTGDTIYDVDPETGEIDPNKEIPYTVPGFEVKVINLTEDLTIDVVNDVTGESKSYLYSETNNGTIVVARQRADQVYTYSIRINSIANNCVMGDIRTINVLTPKFNWLSSMGMCDGLENYQYCQKYITTNEDYTLEQLYSEIDSYKKEEEVKKEETKENFIEKNKKTIIIILIIITVVGGTITVVLVNRRKRRLI